LGAINKEYEMIFVEDGSDDNSYRELCGIYENDKSVKVIKLSKNVGQTIGLLIGMNFARCEVIITMDADLQHDPEDILKLLEKIDLGYDLVNGKKIKRDDNLWSRIVPSFVAKRLVCLLFGLGYRDINSTFRAYRSKIVQDIKQKGEFFRFLPLMTKTKKINFCEVDITCPRRRFGKTHYNFTGRLKRLTKDIFLLLSIKDEEHMIKKINWGPLISELRSH
jgi:glycosyltransferase involved in cell wall biosynthesis